MRFLLSLEMLPNLSVSFTLEVEKGAYFVYDIDARKHRFRYSIQLLRVR